MLHNILIYCSHNVNKYYPIKYHKWYNFRLWNYSYSKRENRTPKSNIERRIERGMQNVTERLENERVETTS